MSSERFQYQGDLSEQPLPEILQTLYRYRAPGVVTAVREEVEKRIYIVGGHVVFATSSDRNDSLGSHLRRSRRINTAEHLLGEQGLLEGGGGRRYGAVLVEKGLLSDEELRASVTEQVKGILWSVFDWESGCVTFEAGPSRAEEAIRLDIPTPQAILDGVKRMRDPKRCVGRLGPSWTVFERGAETPERLELPLSSAERLFLARVDGTRSLRDLVGQGPGDVALNARILYAFWVLKLILRRELTSGIRKLQWRTGSGGFPVGGAGS
ncbi:MAG TPA: DUF4388 domain-containing protein [Thermoanaerobaculia bacterium]|nr:DUF4388 domain-containing protein [Thermoanaerobaculia bacterium]